MNNLEDYNDVYNLTTEMPFYWAICIIENKATNNHLIKNKTNNDYKEWAIKYKEENDIITFIIEGINEETYIFKNEQGGKSIFLRAKYYEFVCSLVTVFFKMPLEYNLINSRLINNLNALYDNGNYKDIIQFIDKQPYYWAMSIIGNKETTNVLNEKQLEEYNKFLDEFFETNNITSFIVSEI